MSHTKFGRTVAQIWLQTHHKWNKKGEGMEPLVRIVEGTKVALQTSIKVRNKAIIARVVCNGTGTSRSEKTAQLGE